MSDIRTIWRIDCRGLNANGAAASGQLLRALSRTGNMEFHAGLLLQLANHRE